MDTIRTNDYKNELKRLEKLVETHTATLKAMFDSTPDLMFCKDLNSRFTKCSKSAEKYFGVRESDIIGKVDSDALGLSAEITGRHIEIDQKVINEKQAASFEEYLPSIDGKMLLFDIIIAPLFQNDAIVGIIGMARNITRRKEAENELALQSATLTTLFDSIPDLIFTKDINLRFTQCNKSMADHFGFRKEDIIGKYDIMSFGASAEVSGKHNELLSKVIQNGRIHISENYLPRFDGTMPAFESTHAPLMVDGAVVGVLGIARDITHRKEIEEDIRRTSDAKSRFIANMNHEMRTPLNVVIGLTDLMLDEKNPKKIKENLKKISVAGNTLMSLINDVLDISKIEAGKLELTPVRYEVASLLNDIIILNIMRIESKDIAFSIDINEDMPCNLYGDDLRVKQILNNILNNAFKYTHEGTITLKMSCERKADDVWISFDVSDTGIGIRREDMEKLFSDYNQVDAQANRKVEGTGLGLSIAQKLVELMDGEILVESEYGKGSTFTVKFRQGFVDDSVIGAETVSNLKELRYIDSKQAWNSQMVRVQIPYARVLVVDDNATNLDVARGMMQAYGMQIDCVSGGQQAVDAIRNKKVRYDAVFMDHMMPEMDGVEATRIIREEIGTEYARTVPIIALTANAIRGNQEMLLNKGFQAFISKPIEIVRLDAIIHQWIRDKEKESKLNNRQINANDELFIERRKGRDRRNGRKRNGRNGKRKDAGVMSGADRQALPVIKNIPGLDITKGLERFGGDEKIYQQVLRSFVTNTRPILETVKEINDGNLEDYIFAVHGIKASSRGIGADSVGDRAEVLEEKARAEDLKFLRANHPAFLDATTRLILAIEKTLGKIAADKPKKDKPDAEILSRIKTACDTYDIDGLDAAMADLEAFEYESDDGLAVWLRENVDRMNYEEINGKIAFLTNLTLMK